MLRRPFEPAVRSGLSAPRITELPDGGNASVAAPQITLESSLRPAAMCHERRVITYTSLPPDAKKAYTLLGCVSKHRSFMGNTNHDCALRVQK